MAASDAVKESLWLRTLLSSLLQRSINPISINIDNQSAIRLIKNPEFHKKTKHIDIRFHFIREKFENGKINISYIHTSNQLADILTKRHSSKRHFLKASIHYNDVIGLKYLKTVVLLFFYFLFFCHYGTQ